VAACTGNPRTLTGNTVWHCHPEICHSLEVPVAMPPPSLEERVQVLSDKAIAAKTQTELDAILRELKAAIRLLGVERNAVQPACMRFNSSPSTS